MCGIEKLKVVLDPPPFHLVKSLITWIASSGIIFSRKDVIFIFNTFYNRSHTDEIMLNMQLREIFVNIYRSCKKMSRLSPERENMNLL